MRIQILKPWEQTENVKWADSDIEIQIKPLADDGTPLKIDEKSLAVGEKAKMDIVLISEKSFTSLFT